MAVATNCLTSEDMVALRSPIRRTIRWLLIAAVAIEASSGANAQPLSEPLRDVEVFSQQAPPEAPREGRARFIDPND